MIHPDNLQQINTNVPRETLVYNADDLVIKRPAPGVASNAWIAKQKHAQTVMNELANVKSNAYVIPQMREISTPKLFAIETRIYGHPINSSYFETLSPQDQDIIYNALAHFINDMNQMRPIIKQRDGFDIDIHTGAINTVSFNTVLDQMKRYLNPNEIKIIQMARTWFDAASENDADFVFSHGDMNENNIFYDSVNRRVSFIDFADAKYENAHYMFERDFAKLGWLDINRLRHEYLALRRATPVIIESNKFVENMRNKLQNFKWTAMEFLKNPQVAAEIRIKMISEFIFEIDKLYQQIVRSEKFSDATKAIGINVNNLTNPMGHMNIQENRR